MVCVPMWMCNPLQRQAADLACSVHRIDRYLFLFDGSVFLFVSVSPVWLQFQNAECSFEKRFSKLHWGPCLVVWFLSVCLPAICFHLVLSLLVNAVQIILKQLTTVKKDYHNNISFSPFFISQCSPNYFETVNCKKEITTIIFHLVVSLLVNAVQIILIQLTVKKRLPQFIFCLVVSLLVNAVQNILKQLTVKKRLPQWSSS